MNDCVLLWFKNDLRLTDNEALQNALLSGKPILPVFCFDVAMYEKIDLGFRKADYNRFLFTTQCVADIREQLIAIKGNLNVVIGKPEIEIAKLAKTHNCSVIFGEWEYAPEELGMLDRLQNNLPDTCALDLSWGKTLYHIDDIPYSIEDIPLTSKAYRINTTKNTEVRKTFDRPEKGNFLMLDDWGKMPKASELGFNKRELEFDVDKEGLKVDLDKKGSKLDLDKRESESELDKKATEVDLDKKGPEFSLNKKGYESGAEKKSEISLDSKKSEEWKPYIIGGETNALKRLAEYSFGTEQLTAYRWTRNRSLGMEYSSKFSPYMALGCISPRTIYWEVKRYEKEIKKNASTWWLIFEIVWRDYFTFKLMRFPNSVFQTEGFKKKTLEFENDTNLFERWCVGKTGIPFVDAHIRQLNETGYMSNRGRVNCASFLIHDYKIDWTWGASYFESKLLDYDVSSNWMNWHYQAFESYYTNPLHQSLKYKASEYIKKYLPELAEIDDALIHAPWLLPESKFRDLGYPNPDTVFEKWQRSLNNIQKKVQPKLDL